jgi:hypothetical protein
MHRVSQAVSSCRLSCQLRRQSVVGRQLWHGHCAGADPERLKPFIMPVTKRVVPVAGFEDLGTEVWEIGAIDAVPEVHILVIPGNPGSAGKCSILRHLMS